jgi:hypothetical protein
MNTETKITELSNELLKLFESGCSNEVLKGFVSSIKVNEHSILPDILSQFSKSLSDSKLDRSSTVNRLKKLLLAPKTEEDYISAIIQDVNKNHAHLPEDERNKMIEEQTNKFKADRLKKRRKLKAKALNKEKTNEELIANFTTNLEKQLSHKKPEDKAKIMEEELKKYKEILFRRNKTIDELVEDEKEEIKIKINEFLNKKYPDKSPEEKEKLFKEHYDKNVKLCREGLEDTKVFNKRMDEVRRELEEIKYADNAEGLDKIRRRLVEIHIKHKKEFLGIEDEKKIDDSNLRTFERGKEPIVKEIPVKPEEDFEEITADDVVELEESEIKPEVTEKETRIRAKYNEKAACVQFLERAIRDKDYFEHDSVQYIYHDDLSRENFTDEDYYYKCKKFYMDADIKSADVNFLFNAKDIDAVVVTEEDKTRINAAVERENKHKERLREKRRLEKQRLAEEKRELEEIDLKLANPDTDEKLVSELKERRDVLDPPPKTPEEQLQDYALEMREKYSKIENVRIERSGIINEELKEHAKTIKREIARDRKLTNERKEKTEELTKLYQSQYKGRALNLKPRIEKEVDAYIKAREKELNTHFMPHGVDPKEHDDVAINNSKIIFADYLKQKDTEVWKAMEPEMKQEFFKAKYPQFFDSFPIVIKFMIQQDKFEVTAFKRFLEKCRTNVAEGANPYAQNMPKKGSMRLTPNEEKWLENQAYYVQYLIEDYRRRNGKRITSAEASWLRNKQLESLRSEMMDFRSNFEKVAEKLKSEHNDNDEQLLKEYIEKIKNGEVELTIEEQENLTFAIEQIFKRKEDIKAKVMAAEKASQKELVDIEDAQNDLIEDKNENKFEIDTKVEFVADEHAPLGIRGDIVVDVNQKTEPAPEQNKKTEPKKLKARDEKRRLMHLRKKASKTREEIKEYEALKLKLIKQNEVEPKKEVEKKNELDDKLGCHCLKYTCELCTVKLDDDEEFAFVKKKAEMSQREPKTWNIYETFIMKKPSNSVLLEYAGGHLEPVSVRQYLTTGEFTINGDKLEIINKNRKYGKFYNNG